MKLPRWLIVSFLHPVLAVLLLACGVLGGGGAVSYTAALLGFCINLPGIWLLQTLLPASILTEWQLLVIMLMTFITWACAAVPICYLIARLIHRWRNARHQQRS